LGPAAYGQTAALPVRNTPEGLFISRLLATLKTHITTVNDEEASQRFELEYKQIDENGRFPADIRFRLLAIIPTTDGVAIFVLSQRLALQAG
jgi:hypothetical protein